MLQNIKVDIIYYLTPTDFEMEFNLCGCCRMRLLTDKVSDRKEFIHSLSRAVSRSRVMICCGSLFGESGLINGVAAAIGKNVVKADNNAYGIKDGGDIGIIDGSMPLVTPEGIFGGCIIESGPQSIILLSESKNIRKSIMTTLIHPYIEELSISPVRASQKTEETAEPQQTEDAVSDIVETAAAPLQESEEVTEEPVLETEADTETQEQPNEETEETVQEAVEAPSNESEPTEIEPTEENTEENEEVSEPEATVEIAAEDTLNMDDMLIATMENGDVEDPKTNNAPLQDVKNEEFELFIEPRQVKFSKKHYYDVDYDAGADADSLFAEPDPEDMRPRFRSPILVLTIILLIALGVLAYILVVIPLSRGYSFAEYIEIIFTAANVTYRPFGL